MPFSLNPGGNAVKNYPFTKQERLQKRREYITVTEDGIKLHTRSFIVFLRANDLGFSRIGITASKKVGNAVKRNRIKRLIREFFRLNKAKIERGIDIVVIAKKEAVSKDFQDISGELGKALLSKEVK